ncbi:hypothetical protein [Aestuariivivens sediminis]|uniref:hypothetical protein n=1 Tax=Aestuariivivens sediminis TaxID=2913557 RepID=UPI001F56382E|nr:hypothetical protein [Aestuariivivens sediminis]
MAIIIEVNTKKELRQFIDFPRRLYEHQPNYISDLDITLKGRLSRRNPFLKHSEMALFLAKESKEGKIVGRIAAIWNKTHLDKYNDSCGFFGFFDAIDDVQICKMLLDQACIWLRSKGIKAIIGPTNPTTNDSCGILCKGFEYPNQINMPYNYPYYDTLLKAVGCTGVIDLVAYEIFEKPQLEKYANIMRRAEGHLHRNNIEIRAMSPKTYTSDITKLRMAYNACNEGSWGFMPLNQVEFEYLASELKSIMPYDLALFAEVEGEIVGYIIAVPDFNQVLRKIRNGKLFPFGIFKILKYRKSIQSARVMLIGIKDTYRGTGMDLVLYQKITEALHQQHIFHCEAGYVMSTNKTMNSLLLKIGGSPTKHYRLYKKQLSEHVS